MADQPSLSVGRPLGRWVLHILILAGGTAAGGLIAYRLTERVLNAGT